MCVVQRTADSYSPSHLIPHFLYRQIIAVDGTTQRKDDPTTFHQMTDESHADQPREIVEQTFWKLLSESAFNLENLENLELAPLWKRPVASIMV